MEAYVTSTIQNGIGTIEFFHPQSNSMPSSQLKNLVEEINDLSKNDEVKVIIPEKWRRKSILCWRIF
jgi:methylglutaconyl-CoA hydratase